MTSIDKSWMKSRRSSVEYVNGVENFIKFACQHIEEDDMKIKCPCISCNNRFRLTKDEVEFHLLDNGIMRNYTVWYHHGEVDNEDDSIEDDIDNDDMFGLIRDTCPEIGFDMETSRSESQEPNDEAKRFYKLLNEAKQPLYAECKKYSNLSFILKLMHLKTIGNLSNNIFNILLKLLKDAFPMCDRLPVSNYETKKSSKIWASIMRR